MNADPNDQWIKDNVNDGHLDYYFYLLAGIMFAAYLLYCHLCNGFEYTDVDELERLNNEMNEQNEREESSRLLLQESTHSNSNLGPIIDDQRNSILSNHSDGGGVIHGEDF